MGKLENQAQKKAQEIGTISRYSSDRLVLVHQINPKKIKILPCVVDSNKFTKGKKINRINGKKRQPS
jgi:hypothetical protein